jgi:hypothetical protein
VPVEDHRVAVQGAGEAAHGQPAGAVAVDDLQRPDWLRRWVRPNQPRAYDAPPTGPAPASGDDRPALVQDRSNDPTLADDLLCYEHPLL